MCYIYVLSILCPYFGWLSILGIKKNSKFKCIGKNIVISNFLNEKCTLKLFKIEQYVIFYYYNASLFLLFVLPYRLFILLFLFFQIYKIKCSKYFMFLFKNFDQKMYRQPRFITYTQIDILKQATWKVSIFFFFYLIRENQFLFDIYFFFIIVDNC